MMEILAATAPDEDAAAPTRRAINTYCSCAVASGRPDGGRVSNNPSIALRLQGCARPFWGVLLNSSGDAQLSAALSPAQLCQSCVKMVGPLQASTTAQLRKLLHVPYHSVVEIAIHVRQTTNSTWQTTNKVCPINTATLVSCASDDSSSSLPSTASGCRPWILQRPQTETAKLLLKGPCTTASRQASFVWSSAEDAMCKPSVAVSAWRSFDPYGNLLIIVLHPPHPTHREAHCSIHRSCNPIMMNRPRRLLLRPQTSLFGRRPCSVACEGSLAHDC